MTLTKAAVGPIAVLASAALLAACGGGGSADPASSGAQSASPAARDLACTNTIVNTDAPQVSVWAWYPNFELIVDQFNQTHDDVQVCWNNAGVNIDEYSKLFTAFEAGSGAPDVAMIETAILPQFTLTGKLVNLSEHGAEALADQYSQGVWEDVSGADGVYAIPKDGGPVGLLYRADIYEQYGIEVPTTWEEFAQAGRDMKAAGYTGTFVNVPTNGKAFSDALLATNEAVPYEYDSENPREVVVNVDSPEVVEVLDYWNGLIDEGVAAYNDRNTSEDNARLLNGEYANFIAAAWGPGYLMGLAEGGETQGQWRAAPLPQWSEGDDTQVNWGGSTFAVTDQAPDAALAAQVAMELLGDEEQWRIGIEQSALFPLWKPALESESFANQQYPFFGGQQINKEVFIPAAAGYEGFSATPFHTYVYDQWNDALFQMGEGEMSPEEAAKQVQESLTSYGESQGFDIKE
jgi:multiple sugar transport system substrate-binding protein